MKKANLGWQDDSKMSQTIAVHFDKQIVSAKVLNGNANGVGSRLSDRAGGYSGANTEQILMQDLEAQKAAFSQACQTLNGVIAKLNQFYDKVYVEHKEEIAKLSVEIARKILMQKVEDGNYEIESIIKEALKNAQGHQDVVVHLNPEDLAKCQKAQQDEPSGALAGIKLVSDPNIGRAECVLENPEGIIKSLIGENLERIGKALKKAE
jgi:flagellar biosynthesis/type III secretory pathway protein FliH